jgi:hypothetical protein
MRALSILPIALLLSAIANIFHKVLELQRLQKSEWTWMMAMAVALMVIELVDFMQRRTGFGSHIPHLGKRLWIARLVVIAALAIARVNADVGLAATDELHRSMFRVAATQEISALRATQEAWSHQRSIPAKAYLAAVAREKHLAASLELSESAQDIGELAKQLDDGPNPASPCAPIRGYFAIVSRKVRISPRQHLLEWADHGSDLLLQFAWLLLPYWMGSIAFSAFEKRVDYPIPAGTETVAPRERRRNKQTRPRWRTQRILQSPTKMRPVPAWLPLNLRRRSIARTRLHRQS